MLFAGLLLLAQADVVVFVLDDVSVYDIALYGGPVQMPNLEVLAASGVTFSRAYANPMCMPSRRSLMTGSWAISGTGDECTSPGPQTPAPSEVFLPEALPGHTSGIVGKWHLGSEPLGGPWELAPISRGFDAWVAGHAGNVGACGGSGYGSWVRVNASAGGYSSAIVNTYEPVAVRDNFNVGWMGTASPKLAVVCSNLPHGPFHVPPGYSTTEAGQRPRYELMIQAWDEYFGDMLQRIDLETTLVIVVGDNGTPSQVTTGDASKAKFTTYERGVRVPLVVAGCGVSGGRVNGELVHIVDVFATAIEAGGGTAPASRSVSLGPILRDEAHPEPHQMVLVGHNWGVPGSKGNRAAVSSSGVKLRQEDLDGDGVVDLEELYDLNSDPLEAANVIGSQALALEEAGLRAFILQESP